MIKGFAQRNYKRTDDTVPCTKASCLSGRHCGKRISQDVSSVSQSAAPAATFSPESNQSKIVYNISDDVEMRFSFLPALRNVMFSK